MRLETASLISFGQSLRRLIYKGRIFADEKSGRLEARSNNIKVDKQKLCFLKKSQKQ